MIHLCVFHLPTLLWRLAGFWTASLAFWSFSLRQLDIKVINCKMKRLMSRVEVDFQAQNRRDKGLVVLKSNRTVMSSYCRPIVEQSRFMLRKSLLFHSFKQNSDNHVQSILFVSKTRIQKTTHKNKNRKWENNY